MQILQAAFYKTHVAYILISFYLSEYSSLKYHEDIDFSSTTYSY